MQVAYQILGNLSQGKFCSGEVLAKTYQISRARVWQAIELLRTWGLEIYSVPGRGYRLENPMELLEIKKIRSGLHDHVDASIQRIDYFHSLNSTNTHILQALQRGLNYSGYAVLAESQTQGRGRMGRTWESPYGKHIYLSLYWPLRMHLSDLSSLSLVIGSSIVQAIEKCNGSVSGLGLKWPNDIWFQDKKLAGVLIESRANAQCSDTVDVVIGVGCNVSRSNQSQETYAPISLEEIYKRKISRNKLIPFILNEMIESIKTFEREGLKPFIALWESRDLLVNRMIEVHLPHQEKLIGRYLGIDPKGALCIETNHRRKTFSTGEIRVRPYAVSC